MARNRLLTKILALSGTVMVLLPLFFMLFTGVAGSIMSRRLLVDYMIPAEMFPFVLVGGVAVLWASLRTKMLVKPIAWTVGASLLMLILCQGIASLTGLASGKLPAESAPGLVALVTGMLIVYDLGTAILGYLGIRLTLAAWKKIPVSESAPNV